MGFFSSSNNRKDPTVEAALLAAENGNLRILRTPKNDIHKIQSDEREFPKKIIKVLEPLIDECSGGEGIDTYVLNQTGRDVLSQFKRHDDRWDH